ncbi:hypothetical protein BHE97_14255 [Aeromicrobium sp. PE09-221]|uniref:hypothetical protein n=1 Tax=Aeromicrobium sp. PE09-221 TaxID=1898043 RepID=UPI000B3E92E3|nr:hypothetical protein [Aeromicrobium sp. PE09-221]OUZ08369.1 hypothetical protein BHE97_14255 [Aeromicrobium sp. PE09-221]
MLSRRARRAFAITPLEREFLTITFSRFAPLYTLVLLGVAIAALASLGLSHRLEAVVLLTVLVGAAALHRWLAPALPRGRW